MIPSEIWGYIQRLYLAGRFDEAAALARIAWVWPPRETYEVALEQMYEAAANLGITLGARLAPALAEAADNFAKLARALTP
jgi:hypothetical protein